MEIAEFIHEVETSFAVSGVCVDGIPVWPYLRQCFIFQQQRKAYLGERRRSIPLFQSLRRMPLIVKGARRPFPADYLVLTSTDKRRMLNGVYLDRIAEGVREQCGAAVGLQIVQSTMLGATSYGERISRDENLWPSDFFHFRLLSALPVSRSRIEGEAVLLDINRRYGLTVPYRKYLGGWLAVRGIVGEWLERVSPRLIFSTCYYGLVTQAFIYEGHQRGVPTIELQHAAINRTHAAYRLFYPAPRDFLPDWLFAEGPNVLDMFGTDNSFISRDRVHVIGNFFCERVYESRQNAPRPPELQAFRLAVCVPRQATVEQVAVRWINRISRQVPDVAFVVLPRNPGDRPSGLTCRGNVFCGVQYDFYQLCPTVDLHATVYSNCALEAPALGTPNLLLNAQGKSRWYFGGTLTESSVNQYADTPDHAVRILKDFCGQPSESVRQKHANVYATDYSERLSRALRAIGFVGRDIL